MNLSGVWQAIRTGWWLMAGAVLLCVGTAAALTYLATPLYASSTKLFVSASGTTDTTTAYQGNLFSQQRVASYTELLTGVQLATRVVEELDLDMTPEQAAALVTATTQPDTVILQVQVTDTSPERAQAIAASLGRQFSLRVGELETPEGSDVPTVKVTTVQEATFDGAPVSPDTRSNLTLGGLLGMLLGVGLALLRSRLDNTVKTGEDIRELTGAGLIGTVLDDPQLTDHHLVTDQSLQSISSESYRAIRTNLQFLDVDNPPRVIVISSALAGEGKSTMAVNVATVLAQFGSRVTLIEADLRRPRVTRYMGLVAGAGLTDVLAGKASLHDVAQPWGDGHLTVLAAGPMPPNPSELLGSAQMRSLLAHLRTTNDFVLIDAPPLLPVTDAAILSVLSDGCVLSTRYGKTRREELSEAAATLERIDARLLGVVLNRVPPVAGKGRGYGYGYGYEADADRERTTEGTNRPVRSRQSESRTADSRRRPMPDLTSPMVPVRGNR
ncbi:polysaccharide biosynthesis tyrosine autokinase [Geodermatophilus sp. SYSU D00815]